MRHEQGAVLVVALVFFGFLSFIAVDEYSHSYLKVKRLQQQKQAQSQDSLLTYNFRQYLNHPNTFSSISLQPLSQSIVTTHNGFSYQTTVLRRQSCQLSLVLAQCEWVRLCASFTPNNAQNSCVNISIQGQIVAPFWKRWRIYGFYPKGEI